MSRSGRVGGENRASRPGGRATPGRFRSGFGAFERTVAKVLLAAALLPTGPLLGLGLPSELGFETFRDGETRRVSSLELAAERIRPAVEETTTWTRRQIAAASDGLVAAAALAKASIEGIASSHAAPADEPPTPADACAARPDESAAPQPPRDPDDPFGIRERSSPRPSAGEIPPPPSPPDFSIARRAPRDEATTSRPTLGATPAPEVAVPVLPTWNLLSISWTPGDPSPAAVLDPIAAAVSRVFAFDACDPADPWKLYDPNDPGTTDLAAITPAIGFWLEGSSAATLPDAGPEPVETAIPLCVGWNLVGFPVSSPRPVAAALASIAGQYLRVFAFDPTDPEDPWEVYDPAVPAWVNDLAELRPGRGYWIYATAATTLTISNASDGPTVAILDPVDLDVVTEPSDVVGTVRSPSLAGWDLGFRAEGDATWIPIATGSSTEEAQLLGAFDPTLLENGLYELRLAAADTLGRVAEQVVDVVVDGQMKIGNFALTFVDLEVPLAGLPIQVLRTYDSRRRARSGDFGFGWTLEIRQGSLVHNRVPGTDWRIAAGTLPCQQPLELAPHLSTVRLSDREIYRFRPVLSSLAPTGGGCFAQVGYQLVDGPVPGATLEVLGSTSVFWANGDTRLVDTDTFELFHPARVRLTTRDGRRFELERGVGVTRILDANGNALDFSASGIAHSTGVSIAFDRDAEGRITRIADPAGGELLYAYDADGDLATFTDRTDAVTSFRYLAGHLLEEIEDPLGRTPIRNEYDAEGRLTRHVDAYGHEIVYDHRIGERLEVVTNRLGASRELHYDARGNVVLEVDESGVATARSFDGHDQLLSEAVGGLTPTTYAYDAARNLTSVVDPLGHASTFTYDAKGNVLTSTDPLGHVTANVYDARGNLLQTADPAGQLTTYTYDARGNLLSEIDPLGGVTGYAYDARGNLRSETDALGHVATYAYDLRGNRTSETRTRTRGDGTTETLVTTFAYDDAGRLLATTAPDGSTTASEYDALGQVTATVDPLGRRTTFLYDELGRQVRVEHPDGTADETDYDAEGRRLRTRDRAGRTTAYFYDAAGRLLRTRFPDGAEITQEYDAAGRLARTIDARGHATLYTYDAAGRRAAVTDALGNTTIFGYDDAGNATRVTDPRGAATLSIYDTLGRLSRTVFADGTQRRSEYDALGRRTAEVDESGVRTEFAYDALGRLTEVTDALGGVTTYAYDELGNRISQSDANGRTTRYDYDALGRQTARVLPDGATERFTYDAAGQRKTRVAFDGALTRYSYDLASRLTRRDYPGGSAHRFSYTPTGRRATMTDARGTTTYAYDLRDRPTGIAYPDGRELAFAYDAAGNRTNLTATVAAQTLTTTYTYDDLNRLETVTDPDGGVTTHAYDANGNRAALVHPNSVTTSYTYDARNRLRDLTATNGVGETIAAFAYTLAPTGNRTKIVEHDGTTRHYQYDPLYRLTDEHVRTGPAPDAPTAWHNELTYDSVGNRTQQLRTQGTGAPLPVVHSYDTRDRLLTENEIVYTWDADGNQTGKTGPDAATYDWDFENRLTRATLADGTTVEHTYDPDGTRVRTVTTPPSQPAQTVDYLVDPWHQTSAAGRTLVLSQVVAETDGTGTLTAYHVRGDDLLATLRPDSATPGTFRHRYFHAEGIGTIRALTDEQGTVTDRYTLEAFGTLLDHQGDDLNAYLFTGEPLDPNTGFYYNRARWLDPTSGRFGSADPFRGFLYNPSSLHRYLYAGGDPALSVDPLGLTESLPSQLTALAARAIATIGPILNSLRVAFGTGDGGAIGRLFNRLGAVVERIAIETFELFPRIAVGTAQLVQRALDFSLRFAQRFALVEVKYAIPRGFAAFTRLVEQLTEAVQELPRLQGAAQEAQVVLWTYKEPALVALRRLNESLGPGVASRVQIVHGVHGLYHWIRFYFGQ